VCSLNKKTRRLARCLGREWGRLWYTFLDGVRSTDAIDNSEYKKIGIELCLRISEDGESDAEK